MVGAQAATIRPVRITGGESPEMPELEASIVAFAVAGLLISVTKDGWNLQKRAAWTTAAGLNQFVLRLGGASAIPLKSVAGRGRSGDKPTPPPPPPPITSSRHLSAAAATAPGSLDVR